MAACPNAEGAPKADAVVAGCPKAEAVVAGCPKAGAVAAGCPKAEGAPNAVDVFWPNAEGVPNAEDVLPDDPNPSEDCPNPPPKLPCFPRNGGNGEFTDAFPPPKAPED